MSSGVACPASGSQRAAQPRRRGQSAGRSVRLLAIVAALAIAVAACSTASGDPGPTPADFTAIVASLRTEGILVNHVVAGEAGCSDPTLVPTAISFDAQGIDQPTPVRVHLYIFSNGSVYTRLRSEVDACARSYIKDPATYATVDSSPYVAAGLGPWGEQFKAAMRTGLQLAATPDTVGP